MSCLKGNLSFYIFAICLVTAAFTSGCSRKSKSSFDQNVHIAKPNEDVTAEENAIHDTDTLMIPWMPSTDGPPGKDSFPPGWEPHYRTELEPDYAPIGTSDLNALCNGLKWTVPLPTPAGPGSIITTSSTFRADQQSGHTWPVEAEIANLEVGKKYSITVKVSTSKTVHSQYANKARFEIFQSESEYALVTEFVDLKNNPNRWITKIITFVSIGQKATLCFSVETEKGLTVNYGNIYVGPDAIKMSN